MLDFNGRCVLVLAPHTDDAELGMGGTIAKIKRCGGKVIVVAFSPAEQSLPEGFPPESTKEEFFDSMRLLGVDEYSALDFEVREFPRDRQKILDCLIKLRAKFNPDVVFLPSSQDVHQDHATVCAEGKRAFKTTSILGYEMPWNSYKLEANFFVRLSNDDVRQKLNSIKCYKSQLAKNSIYLNEHFMLSQMKLSSVRLGKEGHVELFEVIRWVDE